MSVISDVKSILEKHGYPVEADEYGGDEERYFVIMVDTRPANFADNAPQNEVHSVMLHFVAPKTDDISDVVTQIKRDLFDGGFTWPSVVPAGDSEHWREVFEFKTARSV